MLLPEYSITPDVFDINSYSSDDYESHQLCGLYLKVLTKAILKYSLVRDLNRGQWSQFIKSMQSRHPDTQHRILATLRKNKRLIIDTFCTDSKPSSYQEWCELAINSHEKNPLNYVLVSKILEQDFVEYKPLITSIQSCDFLENENYSLRLNKTISDYVSNLDAIFKHSNSIMLIDPYLYLPQNLEKIINIIQNIHHIKRSISLELHLSGEKVNPDVHVSTFNSILYPLKTRVEKIKIFYWHSFHDRYLISDLIGINLRHGFQIDNNGRKSTWTRLSNQNRDELQKEFTPNRNRNKFLKEFIVK